jgi:hypothetical protein
MGHWGIEMQMGEGWWNDLISHKIVHKYIYMFIGKDTPLLEKCSQTCQEKHGTNFPFSLGKLDPTSFPPLDKSRKWGHLCIGKASHSHLLPWMISSNESHLKYLAGKASHQLSSSSNDFLDENHMKSMMTIGKKNWTQIIHCQRLRAFLCLSPIDLFQFLRVAFWVHLLQ